MTASTTTDRTRVCLPIIIVLLLTVPALTGGDSSAQPPSLATPQILSAPAVADTVRVLPPVVCGVGASDVPDDGGGIIRVTWEVSEGAPGAQVRVSHDLERYRLPSPPAQPVEDVRASLRFLETGDRRVTVPLWAAMYLAPLASFVPPSFTVWP